MSVTDLPTLANIAEVLGGAAVVGGIIFAIYQISHLRRQRRDLPTFESMRTFQGKEFRDAIHRVACGHAALRLGEDPAEEVRFNGNVQMEGHERSGCAMRWRTKEAVLDRPPNNAFQPTLPSVGRLNSKFVGPTRNRTKPKSFKGKPLL